MADEKNPATTTTTETNPKEAAPKASPPADTAKPTGFGAGGR